MQDNIRKICQKTLLIAAFAGCMGCSSAKETTASATIAQESQEKTSEAATTTVAAVESTTAAVATVAQPTSTAESPSSIAETTVAASETATSALESTRSVEPVYFEGSEGDILDQKMALGRENYYAQVALEIFLNMYRELQILIITTNCSLKQLSAILLQRILLIVRKIFLCLPRMKSMPAMEECSWIVKYTSISSRVCGMSRRMPRKNSMKAA